MLPLARRLLRPSTVAHDGAPFRYVLAHQGAQVTLASDLLGSSGSVPLLRSQHMCGFNGLFHNGLAPDLVEGASWVSSASCRSIAGGSTVSFTLPVLLTIFMRSTTLTGLLEVQPLRRKGLLHICHSPSDFNPIWVPKRCKRNKLEISLMHLIYSSLKKNVGH